MTLGFLVDPIMTLGFLVDPIMTLEFFVDMIMTLAAFLVDMIMTLKFIVDMIMTIDIFVDTITTTCILVDTTMTTDLQPTSLSTVSLKGMLSGEKSWWGYGNTPWVTQPGFPNGTAPLSLSIRGSSPNLVKGKTDVGKARSRDLPAERPARGPTRLRCIACQYH